MEGKDLGDFHEILRFCHAIYLPA